MGLNTLWFEGDHPSTPHCAPICPHRQPPFPINSPNAPNEPPVSRFPSNSIAAPAHDAAVPGNRCAVRGSWTIFADGEMVLRHSGELVDRLDIGTPINTGTRVGDRLGLVSNRGGEATVSLIDLAPENPRVVFELPAMDVSTVHPSLDGGLHVPALDGTLTTYDAAGELVSEFDTGADNVRFITLDPVTERLAVGTSRGVVLIDTKTGETEQLRGGEVVTNLGFARDGSMMVITGADGTVRLWDQRCPASPDTPPAISDSTDATTSSGASKVATGDRSSTTGRTVAARSSTSSAESYDRYQQHCRRAAARVRRWLIPTSLRPSSRTSPGPKPSKQISDDHGVDTMPEACTVTSPST